MQHEKGANSRVFSIHECRGGHGRGRGRQEYCLSDHQEAQCGAGGDGKDYLSRAGESEVLRGEALLQRQISLGTLGQPVLPLFFLIRTGDIRGGMHYGGKFVTS